MTRGILGTTVRFGSRRVSDGGRRVADADEDIVTLTVAALRGHLAKNGQGADAIGELFLVGRFDDAAAGTILSALGRSDIPVSTFADAPLAAADALLVASARDTNDTTYVVAASDGRGRDVPDGWGAAAAVLTVGADASIQLTKETHHRAVGVASAARAAAVLETLGASDAIALAPAMQRPADARTVVPRTHAAAALPMPLVEWGALGSAAPLVALAHALDTRGERELVWWVANEHGATGARFSAGTTPEGGGVADAMAAHAVPITGEAAVRARDAWASGGMTAQGAFVSMQTYLGQADARYRWVGQHCTACDLVVFPPRESCPSCAASPLAPHPLSGRGTVYARTHIGAGGAPTEFAPLQDATGAYDVAIVALEEGPRVAAMCTASSERPEIGTPVRFELRLLYVQDGAARYGFKAVPAPGT